MIEGCIKRQITTAIAALIILRAGTALAGISAAPPYGILSDDGVRVLVMMTNSPQADSGSGTVALPAGVVGIRRTFPSSGCYDAVTFKPIWRANWYSLPKDLRYTPDFSCVARRNRFAMTHGPAIQFYHDGILTRQYNLDQLLVALKNPAFFDFTSEDWHVAWYADHRFSLRDGECTLSAQPRRCLLFGYCLNVGWHEEYRFNPKTGDITHRHIGGIIRAVTMLLVLPLALLTTAIETIRRSIRWVRRWTGNTAGFPVFIKRRR